MALAFLSSFKTRLKAIRDASSMQTWTNSQPMPRWRLTTPVCRPVIRWPTEPIRPSLDIDVDELTRLFPLVTADGLRFQSAQLVQAQTTQNAADGGRLRRRPRSQSACPSSVGAATARSFGQPAATSGDAADAAASCGLAGRQDLQRGTVTAICGWSAGRRLRLMRRPAASGRSSPGARSALDRERS